MGLKMVSTGTRHMEVLKDGIKAVAVGVSGSKPVPEELVKPVIQVQSGCMWCAISCIKVTC